MVVSRQHYVQKTQRMKLTSGLKDAVSRYSIPPYEQLVNLRGHHQRIIHEHHLHLNPPLQRQFLHLGLSRD